MADLRRAPGLSAEDVSAAVRIHADRVHDFVRRLGCSPAAAVEVVETSALDLVDAVVTNPEGVGDPVGWWFGRARALGRRVAGARQDLPLGGGILSADQDQALLAEALDVLPERERVALLLRDSYALPASAVGVALGTDAEAGMETVGRARLSFQAAVGDDGLRDPDGHPVQLGVLARLAEGGPVAAADATTRRHAQSCPVCRSAWEAQTRAHQALAGLTVVALPEELRQEVLDRVDAQSRAYLPTAAELLLADDEELVDDGPGAGRLVLYAGLALLGAIAIGTLIGLLLSRSPTQAPLSARPSDPGAAPAATPSALPTAAPTPTLPSPPATAQPTPSVFLVSPSPSSGASSRPTGPEPATEPLTLTAVPSSGPNGAPVSVDGTGWQPRGTVVLDYLDPLGQQTGSHATATVDARGRFTTTLYAQDPSNLPGRHRIRASDGSQTATTTYDVSG